MLHIKPVIQRGIKSVEVLDAVPVIVSTVTSSENFTVYVEISEKLLVRHNACQSAPFFSLL